MIVCIIHKGAFGHPFLCGRRHCNGIEYTNRLADAHGLAHPLRLNSPRTV